MHFFFSLWTQLVELKKKSSYILYVSLFEDWPFLWNWPAFFLLDCRYFISLIYSLIFAFSLLFLPVLLWDLVAALRWNARLWGWRGPPTPGPRQMIGSVWFEPRHIFCSLLSVLLLFFSPRLQTVLIGSEGESAQHCSLILYLPGDNPFRCLELALMSASLGMPPPRFCLSSSAMPHDEVPCPVYTLARWAL